MKVGYARVSSVGQSLDIQRDKLSKECQKVFEEKLSGTNMERPELKKCLEYVREGDILVITKLDRLARSVLDLSSISKLLKEKGVELQVLDQNIDTSTPTGRLLFNMLGAIAEFENEIRKERQRDGIAKAKADGKYSKMFKLNESQIKLLRQMKKDGKTTRELCGEFGIKKSSVYNYLKEE